MGRLKIETISPIHISSGVELTPFDYTFHSGQGDRVVFIDLDKLFHESEIDPNRLAQEIERVNYKQGISEILKRHNIAPLAIAQYSLETRAERTIAPTPIKEQIKNIHNLPYIPGSEIKGALRTGILWGKLNQDTNLLNEAEKLLEGKLAEIESEVKRKWREQSNLEGKTSERDGTLKFHEKELSKNLEDLVFGDDPKRDILKALYVGDSEFLNTSSLQVYEIATENLTTKGTLAPLKSRRTGREFRNYLEGISPGNETSCKYRVEDNFWKLDSANYLQFEDRKVILHEFVDIMKVYGQEMAKSEMNFYKRHNFAPGIEFYRDKIIECELNDKQFFLPIGWGAGQHMKTVLDMFNSDRIRFLFSLRDVPETRLGSIVCKKHPTQKLRPDKKSPLRFFCYECMKENRNASLGPEDVKFLPYSKTRRFVFENGEPKYPLGWVKVEVET